MNIAEVLKSSPLKIEMGTGTRPHKNKDDGWLHNDIMKLPGIELVAPCDNLGLPKNSVNALYSSHMLEHIHWDLCLKTLKYWESILKPGGTLEIICPNAGYAMREFLRHSEEGTLPPAMIYRVIWGTRDAGTEALPPNNVHHFGFTKKMLKTLLKKAGFVKVTVINKNRFGIPDRDIIATCSKKYLQN